MPMHMDAYTRCRLSKNFALTIMKREGVPVLDDNGKVLPEVVRVMEICAEVDITFRNRAFVSRRKYCYGKKSKRCRIKKVCRNTCQFRYLENDL